MNVAEDGSCGVTTFWATVAKVQTMADGGKRVWLDLPEDSTLAAAEMMEYQRCQVVLDVVMAVRATEPLTDLDDETEKGPERSGIEVDRRRVAIRRDK